MDHDERLDRLERAVNDLRRELASLRAERAEREPAAPTIAEAAPPPPPPELPPPRYALPPLPPRRSAAEWLAGQLGGLGIGTVPRDRQDVEALVGRYGTVALAALLILMGVGAFLTWAIAEFTIGPRARVALGAVAAAVLGGVGWRIRTRAGARRYGDVLLALALAVVHVDAWGAGPYLGLLSPGASLAVAAIASVALATLAWRERDQPLFVVGVGGALVAPFVTSAGPGHPFVLPTYGALVLTTGALALPRDRRWPFATRLMGAAGAAYAAAMLSPATQAAAVGVRAEVPALFALVVAVGALLAGGAAAGPWLALAHVVTTGAAVIALALDAANGAPRLAWIAGAADVVTYAALWRVVRAPEESAPPRATARAATTALLLPLALLVGALMAVDSRVTWPGAVVGLAWAALAAAAALAGGRDDPLLGPHVAVAGLASALAPGFLLRDARVARVVALAAHAVAFAALFARVRRRAALIPPLVVIAFAAGSAYFLLYERRAYAYTPFLTPASLAAAAVAAAGVAIAWLAWRVDALAVGERRLLVAAAATGALLWGREELARAVSADVATFLLVGYFAVAGIVAILVGRVRRVAAARQAGLALALYAAFKALVQASELDPVGLRVGSYLLVGGFLLGVGWWYRAAGETAGEARPS